ncbi:hypothetical protein GOX01_19750 [Gluconobacter oxydans]|nr:D-glycero-D-manno-heptose 1,7-bisphosphate phosphatase [Gluconobacter oxydans]GEC61644.1 hypothetical protein GOX01_19750 [Gluconobacter oxydans]
MGGVTVRQCVIVLEDGVSGSLLAESVRPKAFAPCGDRPFLAWLMREMQRFGVEEFVVLVSSCSAQLEDAIEQIRSFLPKQSEIILSTCPFSSGAGSALLYSKPLLRERFFLCHGEALFSGNLSRFLQQAREGNSVLVRSVDGLSRYGNVRLQPDGEYVEDLYFEHDRSKTSGFASSGIYIFDHSIFDHLTENCSLEKDVLPALARNRSLKAVPLSGAFWDIGKMADDEIQALDLSGSLLRPAVFLDRDGVINRDHGWVGTRERFEWESNVRETIARIADRGYHIFIVTNQSGIARGFYSERDLEHLMDWVIDSIREYGGNVDDWRYCPIHPEAVIEKYRGTSMDRKPGPGMLLDLLQRWELCPSCCLMFGDQPSDMAAARAAGVEGVTVGPVSLAELIASREGF